MAMKIECFGNAPSRGTGVSESVSEYQLGEARPSWSSLR